MGSERSRSSVEIQHNRDVAIVRMKPRGVMDEELAQTIGDQLFAVAEEKAYRKLILDLAPVETMNSLMLGKIINFHKKIEAEGGRLALCRIHPQLWEVFETFKLPRLLNIYGTEQEALDSFSDPHSTP